MTWVHIDVQEIVRETDKAFLLKINDEEKWFPKSVISDVDDYEVGDMDLTLSIQGWFASREGLET